MFLRYRPIVRYHEEAAAAAWAFSLLGIVALVGGVVAVDGRRGAAVSASAPLRADLHSILEVAENSNRDSAQIGLRTDVTHHSRLLTHALPIDKKISDKIGRYPTEDSLEARLGAVIARMRSI